MKALQKGAYVKHSQYGLGVVTESDSEYTDIDFDLHGRKKFMTTVMVVEHVEGAPPPRHKETYSKTSRALSRNLQAHNPKKA